MLETTPAPIAATPGGNGDAGNAVLPTFAEQLDGSLKADTRLAQWKDTGLSGLVLTILNWGKNIRL